MQRRRVWGTAMAVAAGLAGVLVFEGVTGLPDAGSDDRGGHGPVQVDTRTVALSTGDGGRSASLGRRDTEPFSMLGVTWADPKARVTGTIEARTRAVRTGTWSAWLRLDGDSGQGEASARRGGTEPAWVGPSDGVEIRVVADGKTSSVLPEGIRLDMIDPGKGPGDARGIAMAPAAFAAETEGPDATASTAPAEPSPSATAAPPEPVPSDSPTTTEPSATATGPVQSGSPSATATTPPASSPAPASPTPTPSATGGPSSTAPRPAITPRSGWGADETISPEAPGYLPGGKIKAVAVHHTAESNSYTCAEAPAVVRGIYAYHVKQLTWKDIGYNFLVDKCGTVYEGRKGGVDRPVQGAHSYGFNAETTGISVLGTYTDAAPSQAAMVSVARIAAWKLGQYGVNPTGTATLTAGDAGTNYFRKSWAKGAQLAFPVIHGHRDGYNTQCPGGAFYGKLSSIRSWAAGPVTGLTVSSVTGATASGGTYHTRGPITVNWSSTTPAAFVTRHEVLVDGAVVATAAGSATSAQASVPAGSHSVQVRAVHQTGKAATSAAVTVVGDVTAPVFTTKPALSLRTGLVNASAVPLTLAWKATDAVGVRDVRLTAPLAATYGPTVSSAPQNGTSGKATTWSLSAYDRAGNRGAASVTTTPVVLQETAAVRTGTWATKTASAYFGGRSYSSATKNSSLTWTFTGRSAALVVSRAATSGQVYVYVDGTKAATVDLKSSTAKYRDAIWTKSWPAAARHTVKIVVVGTAGRPTVTTDGLFYLK
ncbi:N-acetylmuramoyl-L-alanine amidase [Streptomyces purpureus]|uniref:peptidoglycan recognition protein family protein n=1 Tax=Streptomyces purpureus TaxID=1951 RepID=UPI0005934BC3|nr:N-acetylmuramoyl-L-alanine amidase [Streptomyces purpureus]